MTLDPKDLDLPDKFPAWRVGQFDAITRTVTTPKFTFMVDAPTGCGKSLIGAAVQRLLNTNVCYLVGTKQLQDQVLTDFPYAKTVKGRSNYRCLNYPNMFPTISAEECTNSKAQPCKNQVKCPYQAAKRAALEAPLAVLNYSYFLTEANLVKKFSKQKYIIADECDTIEDQLMGFISVVITQRMIDRLSLPTPRFKTKFESWIEWAAPTVELLRKEFEALESELSHTGSWTLIDFKQLKRKNELHRMLTKLKFFTKEVDKNWVWYPEEDKWTFKPVWVAKYAPSTFWDYTQKALGMSATILDPKQLARDTGVTLSTDPGIRKDYSYHQMSSPFPKEHRPVYYNPVANLIHREMDSELPKLLIGVQEVMDKHKEDNILVHTVSYKVRDFLKARLVPSSRIVTHGIADRMEKLDLFKKHRGMVLLSPSMDRGVDLPNDECRVVIITKVPFPYLGDPQVQRRVHQGNDGNEWYAYKTVSKIVQMAGRGVRGMDDYAVTYILDAQFDKVYRESKRLFPPWFQEAVIS